MKLACFEGQTGKVITEQAGRVLVSFDHDHWRWILKGIPGLDIFEQERGRPRKYNDQAAKQRAYRERKAGKALRKYNRRV